MMRRYLLTLLMVGFSAELAAQGDPCATPQTARTQEDTVLMASKSYDTTLSATRLCLGSLTGDGDPIVAVFNAKTPPAADWPARRVNLEAALDALAKYAQTQVDSAPNALQWKVIHEQLKRELALVKTLEKVDDQGDILFDDRFWPQNTLTNRPAANGAIDVHAPLNCPQPPSACVDYGQRKDLIRVFNLVRRLGDYADFNRVNAQLKDALLQNTKWKAYFDDARPQFWWEVMLNGRAMEKKHCRKDPATQIELGYCTVPSEQWIFLHPAAALQWVDGASGQQDLKPAFIVEVFGRNSWTWSEAGAVTKQRGWSLLAAYSDRGADEKKWSYGVMFTYGKDMNLGITTTSDDEIGVLISTRLAARYFEQRQKYTDYLKAKEKDWKSLLD